MRNKAFIILLALSFTGLNVYPSDYPPNVISTLRRHLSWQSVTYQDNRFDVGQISIRSLSVSDQKKWKFSEELSQLSESTKLSIAVNTDGSFAWASSTIHLKDGFDPSSFSLIGSTYRDKNFSFEILTGDRIAIETTDRTFSILLFPTQTENLPTLKFIDLPMVNIWKAPLGGAEKPYENLLHLQTPHSAYLHHDLTKPVIIYAGSDFPKRYLVNAKHVIRRWDTAIGKKHFDLRVVSAPLEVADCLSANKICLRWFGPEQLPWTGNSANAASTFDPNSGLIIGSVITLQNAANANSLSPSPTADSDVVRSNNPTFEWIANTYMKRSKFLEYTHPEPGKLVEALLIHEMGHTLGFSHNFRASTSGTPQSPAASVMDYVPFPIGFNYNHLGKFDREMLRLVYEGETPSNDYVYCNDQDAVEKKPGCNAFDLGDSTEWYRNLSLSTGSIFSLEPASGEPLINYILANTKSLNVNEAARASALICSESDRAAVKLHLQQLGSNLRCDD